MPSSPTCVKEVIIIMENTRTEIGSRRERPTGSGGRKAWVSHLVAQKLNSKTDIHDDYGAR